MSRRDYLAMLACYALTFAALPGAYLAAAWLLGAFA